MVEPNRAEADEAAAFAAIGAAANSGHAGTIKVAVAHVPRRDDRASPCAGRVVIHPISSPASAVVASSVAAPPAVVVDAASIPSVLFDFRYSRLPQ